MQIILFLFCLIFSLSTCQAQSPNSALSPATIQQIDALFKDFDQKDSPGYALGIVKGNQVLYARGYGSANLDYEIPISTQSVFSIASVSKQFTAACIALLIMDDKLDLDSPVGQFIPELNKYADTIRIKHLVYNTSGLHEYYRLDRPDGKSWVTFNYFTVDDCIARALSQDSLLFAPGQRWDYCNINFMLLAKVVEKVSGQSFSQFAKERLFEPLGMNHTLINDDVTTIVKNRVTPYNIRSQEAIEAYKEVGIIIGTEGDFLQHPRNSPHYGGSGVMTTIEDLIKWCVNFYTHDFGGQTFYDIMHATPSFEHNRNNQAFGLYFGETSGKNFVAWDGGDYGISSQLMRFPEEGVAIICLSNLGTGYAAGKVYTIADLLIADGKL